MSDKSKFEQMLEKLVADDRTAAEEIFHDIVVEKSRSIYEGLLEDDIKDIEVEETSKDEETTEASKEDKKEDEKVEEKTSEESKEDEAVEEASKDDSKEEETKEEESKDEEATDESFLDAEQTEIAPAEAHGGDATDDMVGDIEAPAGDMDNGDDSEKGEEEIEDRVVDLEDAIDDLKAEFEKMMGDKGEEGEGDDAEDNGDKEEEAVVDQSAEGETVEVAPELGDQPAVETAEPKTASEEIREYVNKVGVTHTDGSDNSKSPVAGKNDMGGSTSNIAKGGEEKGSSTPASKEDNAGNINVPGAKVKPTAAPKAKTSTEDDSSAKSTIGS